MKTNKKTLILLITGILFFFIVLIALFYTSQKSVPQKTTDLPSPTSFIQKETPDKSIEISSEEKLILEKQIAPELEKRTAVEYGISKIKAYENSWAIIQIVNPSTDPANIILRKENGQWRVIFGPGTYFDEQELKDFGAPQNVIDDVNGSL